ncbi:MAG: XRE family transcriptional regulator [Denitrovibrio sp.]|nr:MAG: XRE family transcriptional regulator [Denitrovibrio sp.]
MSDINQSFAKILKLLRTSKGLTQEELAELSGIDYKYLQKLESQNTSSPTLSTLEKLSIGLKISITDLVSQIDINSD